MAQFADTHAIAHALNQVITKAEKSILLITPYINFPQILFERMLDADERGVKVTVVFGKTRLRNKELDQFSELKHLSLYYLENLHAKCYANDSMMVISSMNLYDFSEKNNREMGVVLTKREDATMFKEAMQECESILKASELVFEPKPVKTYQAHTSYKPVDKAPAEKGYCIRCQREMAFKPNAPLCTKCYQMWSNFKNKNYPEKHCHQCGNQAETSVKEPLCERC